MKRNIFISLLLLGCTITAQQIEKFSIDSGGESFTSVDTQLIYTIGEVNIQELNSTNTKISEGFITPILIVSTANVNTNNIAELSVFPNPISTFLTIKANETISSITIYNPLGQLVKTLKIDKIETTINFSGLSSGKYLLKIEAGTKTITKKIIKK